MTETEKMLEHYFELWNFGPGWHDEVKYQIARLDKVFPRLKELFKQKVNYKEGE